METFTRNTDNDNFSIGGKQFRKRIKRLLSFYDYYNKNTVVLSTFTKSEYVPGVHKLLDNFINHYMNNKYFRESLIMSLFKGYISKNEGVVYPPYSAKVLEYFLTLAASGDKKTFNFLSGNMCDVFSITCSISIRHSTLSHSSTLINMKQ